MADDDTAHASRASARKTPITHTLGAQTLTYAPEVPLDVALALGTLDIVTSLEAQVWLEAHLEIGAACDTSCADDGLPLLARACETELGYRARLKKVRNADGSKVSERAFQDFHDAFLKGYKVSEGESGTSADLPAKAGVDSSGTASEQGSNSTGSGNPGTVVSEG